MNLKGSYDSRFYRISKIFVMFIIIFTIGAGYNNKIRLSESIMIIIICILLLFIQECINKIQKTDSKYKLCEQEYTLSIEAINGAIWIWDDKSNKVYVSNKIRELLGLEKEKITLEEWYKFIIESDFKRVKAYFESICLNRMCISTNIRYSIKAINGQTIHIEYNGKGSISNGIYSLAGVIMDITSEKNNENKIKLMNYYDNITGIQNKKMFIEKFKQLINNSSNKSKLGIIFFDIDNFKNINDSYGHEVGDEILLRLCKRIENILDGRHTFARFGGDEFIIAFSNVINQIEIKDFLDELLLKVRKPFYVDSRKICCSISIGVSIYPNDSNRLDILLKTADMAMHTAKEEGKNRYKFFDINILNILKRQSEIEKALRTAIENNEIFMVFQPKISIKDEKVNGFEALVRWVNDELGFISPAEFIPIAESSGLIIDLGKYIIEESFKKCKELYCSTKSKFHIAINISDIQLREEGFISFISEMLEKYNIPPEFIEFEITEGVIMKSVVKNIELLIGLKRLGVSIALDDFGTGYSSLSYLKRLPIDVLKIDKSFVDGIGVDEKSEYIAESIIKLSHSLNLKVVAEGVETKEQLGYLDKMKCDVAQGYYFSKPEKFEVIKEMI
ncbi:EAL domain-containing protein [uncultured Clostridium sp.]|uniref:sensor domain-containing protein n=1 Tax=uncultured Clostridium sp. TaxID=59620 RepID=UPI0025FDBCD6|nr:EAL domain-containing protein [uncultured Clostridium sp.]